MDVATPDGINAMIRATPGSVEVSYGGVDGWGHRGLPPGMAFEDPDLMVGMPSVVVSAGYFPDICVDPVNGMNGIQGTNIAVGEHTYRIDRALEVSEDGGEILLLLTDPS